MSKLPLGITISYYNYVVELCIFYFKLLDICHGSLILLQKHGQLVWFMEMVFCLNKCMAHFFKGSTTYLYHMSIGLLCWHVFSHEIF
jgi:hypothetical protein